MQNFKDIILKNLCSAVIFFTYLLVMPSVWLAEGADVKPQIFIGNTPAAITVQRGMPVKVPTFFVGGTYANKAVELFIFRTDTEENVVCFGPDGWESDYVTTLEDAKPLGSVGMPEYIYLDWCALDNSQSLSNFDLCVCVDDQIDGVFTASSYCCGCQSIIIEEVDDSTGDDNDTGTGDDSGSGDDDDTGDGGTQPLTPPTFPGFDDQFGGACDSLKFTPEGTSFSYSSISKSLELGASDEITYLTAACGIPVTVSSVTKTSGGTWLSANKGVGSKIILNLNAGVTGLGAGSSNTGTVKVVAGGITDTMSVTLRVLGQCDPTSASVTPTSLTFQAYVGGQNSSAKTIRVKNNCEQAVSATVVSKPNWVTLIDTGTGEFSVLCSEQSKGSYSGTITLRDGEYYEQHSVSVELKVTDTPTTTPDDSVTIVTSGHIKYYNIEAGQRKYFKFTADVSECDYPIQVGNTSKPPYSVHVLIKRGSKPTKDDFDRTWITAPSQYDCRLEQWSPKKPAGTVDLYWKYNIGSQTEFVEINEPMESQAFYIMLYNEGENRVETRLTVRSY